MMRMDSCRQNVGTVSQADKEIVSYIFGPDVSLDALETFS